MHTFLNGGGLNPLSNPLLAMVRVHMRDTANRGTGLGKGQSKRKGKGIIFRPTDDINHRHKITVIK